MRWLWIKRTVVLLGSVVFWTFLAVREILDWAGRAATVEEAAGREDLPKMLEWVLSAPSWISGGSAIILTVLLVYLCWPRRMILPVASIDGTSGSQAPAQLPQSNIPVTANIRLFYRPGDHQPDCLGKDNIHRWYSLGVGIALTKEGGGVENREVCTTVFLVFDRPLTVGTLTVRFLGACQPRYETKDFGPRHAVIVINGTPDNLTVEIGAH